MKIHEPENFINTASLDLKSLVVTIVGYTDMNEHMWSDIQTDEISSHLEHIRNAAEMR